MNINNFLNQEMAIAFVCNQIKKSVDEDISKHNIASLILTGGNTVRPFLSLLSKTDIDWSKVWIILSDERWLPIDHDQSNEGQLKLLFLNNLTKKPNYMSLKTNHENPEDAIHELAKNLETVPQPFSCSLLSMGEDGHIASLFPGRLWQEKIECSIFKEIKRISLSVKYFKECQNNFILIRKSRQAILDTISLPSNNKFYPLNYFQSEIVVF